MAELQARMSSREFSEWMAYYSIAPFGEERADLRSAIVANMVAAAAGSKETKVDDYMPKFGEDRKPKQKSMIEMQSLFNSLPGVKVSNDGN